MTNSIQVIVTQEDLENAIKLRGTQNTITGICVVALAVRRQVKGATSVGINSVHNDSGIMGYLKPRSLCSRLEEHFDEERDEDARAMLPLKLTFEPIAG
jgi:hypothetical protein